uniref:Uncharacterized protein n=1 Tax=Arundo donax TaxID=35708 RepID=A0A0A9BBP9_ARUDO
MTAAARATVQSSSNSATRRIVLPSSPSCSLSLYKRLL